MAFMDLSMGVLGGYSLPHTSESTSMGFWLYPLHPESDRHLRGASVGLLSFTLDLPQGTRAKQKTGAVHPGPEPELESPSSQQCVTDLTAGRPS